MTARQRLLIVQAAGLGHDFLQHHRDSAWQGLIFRPVDTVFPAVTCTVQASFRTAAYPSRHGMVANGLWDPEFRRVRFWEQAATLVEGQRFWSAYRQRGASVAMCFWQQSLGEDADAVVSPAPIHKHHGGLIADCYSQPPDLYASLCGVTGGAFPLSRYWGPRASVESSAWIAEATAALLGGTSAPDLCLTYLPALDYDLQRYGPDSAEAGRALEALMDQLALLRHAAERHGMDLLIVGDYAIHACHAAAFPNCALRRAGLMTVRHVEGRAYADFNTSRAFAVADHEIAHVFVRDLDDVEAVYDAVGHLPGVGEVLAGSDLVERHMDHRRCGDLVLVAEDGWWFAYPWWEDAGEEPDFARHVDIHNKPGYDPCELFAGWPPWTVSTDTSRVRGTHGKAGPRRQVAWASTFLDRTPGSIVGLAADVKRWLEKTDEAIARKAADTV